MTEKELQAIEQRVKASGLVDKGSYSYPHMMPHIIANYSKDVPALVAEVRHLRKALMELLEAKQ